MNTELKPSRHCSYCNDYYNCNTLFAEKMQIYPHLKKGGRAFVQPNSLLRLSFLTHANN